MLDPRHFPHQFAAAVANHVAVLRCAEHGDELVEQEGGDEVLACPQDGCPVRVAVGYEASDFEDVEDVEEGGPTP